MASQGITKRMKQRAPDRRPTWDHPIHVTILTPVSGVKPRTGMFGVKWGRCQPLRTTMAQHDLLAEEATALGMAISEFVRWCAVMVANKLHKERTGNDSDVEP